MPCAGSPVCVVLSRPQEGVRWGAGRGKECVGEGRGAERGPCEWGSEEQEKAGCKR